MASRRQQRMSPIEALEVVTAHPTEGKPQLVPLADIAVDQSIQVRVDGLNEERVETYMTAISNGEQLPPVVLFRLEDGTLLLSSGFHRHEAHKRLERLDISAEIREGTRRDAVTFAFEDNKNHGLPLTNKDKKAYLLARLKDETWAGISQRELARQLGVHHDTVGSWIKESSMTGGNPPVRTQVVGKDGRVYNTANITEANRARTKAAFGVGQLVYIKAVRLVDEIIKVEWVDAEHRYTTRLVKKIYLESELERAAPGLSVGQHPKRNQHPEYHLVQEIGELKNQRWVSSDDKLTVYQVVEFESSVYQTFHAGYDADGNLIYCRYLSGRTWYPATDMTIAQMVAVKKMPPFQGSQPIGDNAKIQVSKVDTTGFELTRHAPRLARQRMGGSGMDDDTLKVYQVNHLTTPENLDFYLGYDAEGQLIFSRSLTQRTWWLLEEATERIQEVALALQPPFTRTSKDNVPPAAPEEEDFTEEELARRDVPPYEMLPDTEDDASSEANEWQQHTMDGGVVNVAEQELAEQLVAARKLHKGIRRDMDALLVLVDKYRGRWAKEDTFAVLKEIYETLDESLYATDLMAEDAGYPIPGKVSE